MINTISKINNPKYFITNLNAEKPTPNNTINSVICPVYQKIVDLQDDCALCATYKKFIHFTYTNSPKKTSIYQNCIKHKQLVNIPFIYEIYLKLYTDLI